MANILDLNHIHLVLVLFAPKILNKWCKMIECVSRSLHNLEGILPYKKKIRINTF